MLDRTERRFDLKPKRLVADRATLYWQDNPESFMPMVSMIVGSAVMSI
jgi:hypothetical protein